LITNWQDVDIYLDGYKIKESPLVTIKDITSGFHTVILVSGDYADVSRVRMQNGETSVIKKYFECVISYDGKTDFSYKVEEALLNTPIE